MNSKIENLLTKGVARIITIVIILILPDFAFADIAGPVLTKAQACEEKDGASMNRLQIFINEKKSDTLYFFKKDRILYYSVPMLPYWYTVKDIYGKDTRDYFYSTIFLYRYDCMQSQSRRISENLKNRVKTFWGPINGEERIDRKVLLEMNYGQISEISSSGILLTLGIPQTGISSNPIFIPIKK